MKSPRPEPTIFDNATSWVGSPASVIAHTAFFIFVFLMGAIGFAEWDMVLLVLTTLVSLEAIYLAIFIQMSVNRQAKELEEVSEDIDEIQEDIDEIQEDVEEISEDVEEISEDVEEIQEDVEELSDEEDAPVKEETAGSHMEGMSTGLDQLLIEIKKIQNELGELKTKLPAPDVKPVETPIVKRIVEKLTPKKPKTKVAKKS